jgi:ABC-2 type transport system permease protein
VSVGAVEPAPLDSAPAPTGKAKGKDGQTSTIGGSARFVPGQSNRQITVVNGKAQVRQRLKDLWRNRDLLVLLTRTQLKVKYKNSVLGYLWSMLNPALVLAVYYVVFKVIARNTIPSFAIFLFCGLLVWNLFNNSAMAATGVVVANAGIVKKVAFPRELLALSTVGVALVLFAIQVVVLILALVVFGITPSLPFLITLPIALLALVVFTSAISVFLSAVNVYLRDTQHLTEVLLMAWFWSIPVVYPYGQIAGALSDHHLGSFKWVYLMDPVTPIALAFQRTMYGRSQYTVKGASTVTHMLPNWGPSTYCLILGVVLVASIILFLLSLIVFGRLEGNFAEEL